MDSVLLVQSFYIPTFTTAESRTSPDPSSSLPLASNSHQNVDEFLAEYFRKGGGTRTAAVGTIRPKRKFRSEAESLGSEESGHALRVAAHVHPPKMRIDVLVPERICRSSPP
jgi:hypothetical protein